MDERKGDQAAPGSRRAIPVNARLSPVQQASADYSEHAGECPRCRDIDRNRCHIGDQLWRDWNDACNDAYQRLHDAR
ncbi:MAG: hypothetical protein HOZ81_04815 [Streptomyces sp.]|nr:hypothetical protein [Streptomyces sp.]